MTDGQEKNKTIVISCTLTGEERERYIYEMREKNLHDEKSALSHAKREGIDIGIAKGRKEGIGIGVAKGREETIAKSMKIIDTMANRLRSLGVSENKVNEFIQNQISELNS